MMQRKVRAEKIGLRQWLAALSSAKESGKNAGLWKYVYALASRPRRTRITVNLTKLERYAGANDNVVVPGKVLGVGNLKKSLNITAVEYSNGAAEKVRKAGGKIVTLEEMMKKDSVRIIV